MLRVKFLLNYIFSYRKTNRGVQNLCMSSPNLYWTVNDRHTTIRSKKQVVSEIKE